ncbi:unnamed protein product [Moneuplotes crassus]|uniref:Uncharacterized protein n=1 Tax=Euplotes crassus TaxID=5936 RepID=A0AAD1X772_EUPCR|nr:unnamed protein product [Moneuplotes crassus]
MVQYGAITGAIRSIDIFAKPISFSKKERFDEKKNKIVTRDYYQTIGGGILVVIILLIMAVYGYILITDPWEADDVSNVSNRRNMDSTGEVGHRNLEETWSWSYTIQAREMYVPGTSHNDTTVYHPFADGFTVAINLVGRQYDPTMFKFVWRVSGATPKTIDVKNCTEDDFHPFVRSQLAYLPLADMKCPSNVTDLVLVGDLSNQTTFSLDIVYCDDNGVNDCANLTNINTVAEQPVTFHWVEGIYNHNTPVQPITYILRSGRQFVIEAGGLDTYQFHLTRNEVHDIDGRTRNFWTVERGRYYYVTTLDLILEMANLKFKLSNGYNRYDQFYDYSTPFKSGRNLASTTVDTRIETSTEKKIEKVEDRTLFRIFYIASQLGGLFSFLVALLGFIMYPITRQLFLQDTVNDLKVISDLKMKQMLNPEEDNDLRAAKPGKDSYGALDMVYNLICCYKSKRTALGLRALEFKDQVKGLNEGRDVINITTSLDMLEYKIDSIEKALLASQMKRKAKNQINQSFEEEKEFKSLNEESLVRSNTNEKSQELAQQKSIWKGEYQVEPVPEVSEDYEGADLKVSRHTLPSSQIKDLAQKEDNPKGISSISKLISNEKSVSSVSKLIKEEEGKSHGISELMEIANMSEFEGEVDKVLELNKQS